MVSTNDIFTYNSKISTRTNMIVKECSARKSLRIFTKVLDVKNKTAVHRIGAAESKRKAIIKVSILWSIITNIK